ncbi:MAG: peptide chain release factor aRF-1, partial [Candidatus Kariarchaeaceae archaeon]
RGGATFATIRGSDLKIVADEDSFVLGKHGRGGQSAGRIERGIEILAQEFYSKMARQANHIFLDQYNIKGLVVGGPSMSKDSFLEHPTLDYRLKAKIIGTYDTGYTGEQGIRELLMRAQDDLDEFAMVKERKLVQRFFEELGKDTGKAIYGEEPIKKAFAAAAVEVLLFSDGIKRLHVKIQCTSCNKEFLEASLEENIPLLETKISQTACPNCSSDSTLKIVERQYLIDEFVELAQESGAEIEIISLGHEDGLTLMNTFGGLAAILRFPVDW